MKIKLNKKIVFMFIFGVIIFLSVFISEKIQNNTSTYYANNNNISIDVYSKYKKETVGEYDLYFSKDNISNLGLFIINNENNEYGMPEDYYTNKINYILNTRDNMKIYEEEKILELEDKTIKYITYQGSYNDTVSNYILSIITFKDNDDYYIFGVNIILKSNRRNTAYINEKGRCINMLKSIKLHIK